MDGFRELRGTLVRAVAKSDVWSKRFEVAWLGALIPGSVDGFEENVKFVRDELAKSTSKGDDLFEQDNSATMQYGGMLYRLKQYDDAVNTMSHLSTKLSESSDEDSRYVRACAEYILAMARHQLGHEAQAQRLLASARAGDESLQPGSISLWCERVALDTLRREATGLIAP
jgi:hypothetical protein